MTRIILSQTLIYDANDTPAPYFGLYLVCIKDRRVDNHLSYPVEDQWHIYGNEGDEYLLAVSKNMSLLHDISEILRQFPRILEFFEIRINTMVYYLENIYQNTEGPDIDGYLAKIQISHFYFHSCCNARNVNEISEMIVRQDIARDRLFAHIDNPETYNRIRDMIVIGEEDIEME